MGIIKRQAIKHSIIQYVGVFFGAIATFFIYTKALDINGLVQSIIAASAFMAPLVSLGSTFLSVKYFPAFKNKANGHNGFLGLMICILFIGCLIYAAVFPFISQLLFNYFSGNLSTEYLKFVPVILPLTCLIILVRLLAIYISNFQRIVVPSILEDLLIKITLPLLFVFYLTNVIPVNWIIYGILTTYIIAAAGLIIYLWYLGEFNIKPSIKKIDKHLKKEMTSYAAFGILTGLGFKSAFKIDTMMVFAFTNPTMAGIYAIANFLTEIIIKPLKGIVGIAQPIISKAIAANNIAEVEMIYKKSSITLLIYGIYLSLGIWLCLNDIFTIMGQEKMFLAKTAVALLLIAKLLNLAASTNNEIINYSKFYRANLVFLLMLAFINIVLNIYLIPKYGISGAAFATLASFIIFNLLKLIFIKVKFGFLPFSKNTLKLLVLSLLTLLLVEILPQTGNSILNILFKGSLLTVIFIPSVFYFKISEDFNQLLVDLVKKLTG